MLIGVFGKSGAGKDTIAEHIRHLDPRFEVRKFATGVRQASEILTDINWAEMVTTEQKAKSLSDIKFSNEDFEDRIRQCIASVRPWKVATLYEISQFKNALQVSYDTLGFIYLDYSIGKLLQLLGTDCFRVVIDEDTWVDQLFSTYKYDQYVVISDVRAPNEEQAIHELGGIVIRVVRPEQEQLADGRSKSHASENWVVRADVEFDNSGTLQELLDKTEHFMHNQNL
jgi:hypothetical protein